eukprot:scaffold5834_cov107-Isochrysis_galbana.AAC.9
MDEMPTDAGHADAPPLGRARQRQRTPHEEAPARGEKPRRGALSAPSPAYRSRGSHRPHHSSWPDVARLLLERDAFTGKYPVLNLEKRWMLSFYITPGHASPGLPAGSSAEWCAECVVRAPPHRPCARAGGCNQFYLLMRCEMLQRDVRWRGFVWG